MRIIPQESVRLAEDCRQRPEVAVIVVNFKGAPDTIECLESLLKQDYPAFRVFVVDNASGDGSEKKIEDWGRRLGEDFISMGPEDAGLRPAGKKVTLIRSVENMGFAGGNNLAMKIALEGNPRYFWLINNDTVQDIGALSALVDVAEKHEKVGMVCSKVLYYHSPDVIESMGSRLVVPLGVFRHIGQGTREPEAPASPFEVPLAYGCSFLVSAALVGQVGLMDERYFLLREESDWCVSARRGGWKIYSAPASRVWHKVSASIGRRSDIFFYYVTRNTLLFMRKHYPVFLLSTALAALPLVAGLVVVDSIVSKRGLFGRIRMMALGYLHFLQGKFGRLNLP